MNRKVAKKILITGATGFVGRALCHALAEAGYDLIVLTRNEARAKQRIAAPITAISWPISHPIAVPGGEIEAVIHLAGESIAGRRWTNDVKKEIRDSRIKGTQDLIQFLEQIGAKPHTFASASAVGYYGNAGEKELSEEDPAGNDFLAQVCQEWEKAILESTSPSVVSSRKVCIRFGVVLGRGGALEKMLPPYLAGVGGKLGTGKQWMSWIHIQDLIRIILECLKNEKIEGPVNATAPHPVRNSEFSDALASQIHTPGFLAAPAPALKIALGEMSQVLLSGQKVLPKKIQSTGLQFLYPTVQSALFEIYSESLAKGYQEYQDALWVSAPVEKVFEFFSEAKNLQQITPEELDFKILHTSTEKIEKGTLIEYRLKLHGIPFSWKTEITGWDRPRQFTDTQLKGPYQEWIHTHHFRPFCGGTLIEDRVLYRLPLGILGRAAGSQIVRGQLKKIFDYRTQKIQEILK